MLRRFSEEALWEVVDLTGFVAEQRAVLAARDVERLGTVGVSRIAHWLAASETPGFVLLRMFVRPSEAASVPG